MAPDNGNNFKPGRSARQLINATLYRSLEQANQHGTGRAAANSAAPPPAAASTSANPPTQTPSSTAITTPTPARVATRAQDTPAASPVQERRTSVAPPHDDAHPVKTASSALRNWFPIPHSTVYHPTTSHTAPTAAQPSGSIYMTANSPGPSTAVAGHTRNNFIKFGAAQVNILGRASVQAKGVQAGSVGEPKAFNFETPQAPPRDGSRVGKASRGPPQANKTKEAAIVVPDDSSDEDTPQLLKDAPPHTKWADQKSTNIPPVYPSAAKPAPTTKDDTAKAIFSRGTGRSISFYLDAGCSLRLANMMKAEGGTIVDAPDAQFLVYNVRSASDLTNEQKAFIRSQTVVFVVTQIWVLQCIADGALGDMHKAHLASAADGAHNTFTNFGGAQYNIVGGLSLQPKPTPGAGRAGSSSKPSPFTFQRSPTQLSANSQTDAGSPYHAEKTKDDVVEALDDSSDGDDYQILDSAPQHTKWADHKSPNQPPFPSVPKAASPKDNASKKIFASQPGVSYSFYLDPECSPRLPDMIKAESGTIVDPGDAQFLVFNVSSAAQLTNEQKAFIRSQPLLAFVVKQSWVLECMANGVLGDAHKAHLDF